MSKFEDALAGLAVPVDRPRRMPILDPTTREPLRDQDGKEAYIELLSADSEPGRKHRNAMLSRRMRQSPRQRTDVEALTADGSDFLAAVTTGWYLVALDGTPIDLAFAHDAARAFYTSKELAWIRAQVDAFVDDLANFVDRPVAA